MKILELNKKNVFLCLLLFILISFGISGIISYTSDESFDFSNQILPNNLNSTSDFVYKFQYNITGEDGYTIAWIDHLISFDHPNDTDYIQVNHQFRLQYMKLNLLSGTTALFDSMSLRIDRIGYSWGNSNNGTIAYTTLFAGGGYTYQIKPQNPYFYYSDGFSKPNAWDDSEYKSFSFFWGEFTINSNSNSYVGLNNSFTGLRISFDETDFAESGVFQSESDAREYQTEYNPSFFRNGDNQALYLLMILLLASAFSYPVCIELYHLLNKKPEKEKKIECMIFYSKLVEISFLATLLNTISIYFLSLIFFGDLVLFSVLILPFSFNILSILAVVIINGKKNDMKYSSGLENSELKELEEKYNFELSNFKSNLLLISLVFFSLINNDNIPDLPL